MGQERAGLIGPLGGPSCPAGQLTTLEEIEDVEGTNLGDNLLGDPGPNQLLGRAGPDNYFAGEGNDHLLVNSGDSDPVVDCGGGFDTALIDFAPHTDGPPVGCESVEERAPNSFRPPDTPPDPEPEPEPELPPPLPPEVLRPNPPARDRTPPVTRLRRRPAALVFAFDQRQRVVFAFSASEPGTRFRCRLDRQPFRPCRSPRAYLVAPGRHAFRVFAIDRAGNRDRTPAVFRFSVRSR
jgi:hypothetical protein